MGSVVLVIIDGLRPDALMAGRSPNLESIRSHGVSTLRADSIMPSVSLPCHMSIFHSVSPARHGIWTNDWKPSNHPLPGIVDRAAAARLRAASCYNWEPLRNLSQPGNLAFSYFRDNLHDVGGDQVIADEAARFIAREHPDFAFVYLGTLDIAGHDHGWMSDAYFAQLERADAALGTLLSALPTEYAVVVQSDHGGHAHVHGTDLPEDMTIPWLAMGPGIRRGHSIKPPVTLLDTAPTIARLLGIAGHAEWEGHILEEIFVDGSG